jgi:opacity protein-like surface antigen
MNARMLLGFGALFVSPALFARQPAQQRESKLVWNSQPKVEIMGSVGVGHVFRFLDRGFGTQFNAGVGLEVTIWRGLRAGAEINRMFGLDPSPAECGSISPGPGQPPFPCTGSARVGVGAATAASFTAAYHFGNGRTQPYVLGGMSILRTQEYTATYMVHTDHVEIRENSSTDTGVGMTFGAGLRTSVTRRLSIRPEFRYSDGTALSASNLSQFRFSVGIGYGW